MKKITSILLITILIITLSGCGTSFSETKTENQDTQTLVIPVASSENLSSAFAKDDLDFDWQNEDHETIMLNNDSSVTITSSGIYEITGSLKNGNIIVDIDKSKDEDALFLVLNNADITSSDSAPIYIKSAKKTVILLAEGSNNFLKDTNDMKSDENNDPNSTIFSKDDLTITGKGNLTITSNYNDAINSKDDLFITGGNISIESIGDGLVGKDNVEIANTFLTIKAGKDGIRSTNDEDEGKGNVIIHSGTFVLNVGDDGIHGENNLIINDGKITITNSYEGLESAVITINGGDISINSEDDGINTNLRNSLLTINGGTIYVNAKGDGVDSNGQITMTGGKLVIDGPVMEMNAAIDYDYEFNISGGLLVASGSLRMSQATSSSSLQPTIHMSYGSSQTGGSTISLRDQNGNILISHTPAKSYGSVVLSSADLALGEKYSLYSNELKLVDFTLENTITYLNESGITTQTENFGPQGGPQGIVRDQDIKRRMPVK